MKTVIIEDDSVSRAMLSRLLTSRGHEVHAFRSAEEAMVACQREFFPLMILDLHLPGIDGLDFCRWVRMETWGAQVYILCATGRNGPEDLQAVLDAGANDYVSKPLDVALLQIRLAIAERQAHEISQRKFAQELNRSILSTTPDGFWITDRIGNILDVNKAYCQLTGYSPEELIGRKVADIEDASSSDEVARHLQNVIKHGQGRYETRHTCKDRRVIDLDVSVSFYPEAGGRFFAFLRDNTERKKLNEERLKKSNMESIGLLAGGIAHEFNNVLTAIIGNISLTQMELASSHAAQEWLNNAQDSAGRATTLARHLLTFAKGGEPIKKTVDVGPLLKEWLAPVAQDTRLRLSIDTPSDLWPAEVDPGQIHQVIENLLTNAKEAMPEGGPIIVTAENVSIQSDSILKVAPGSYVRISIRDNGPGIPEKIHAQIFDPYFTTKKSAQGLGLAICYSILKKHRGAVTFTSQTGTGSTFSIFLPVTKQTPPPTPPAAPAPAKSNGRVLIMDDDPGIRDLTKVLLTRSGYQVSVAAEGREALKTYAEAKADGRPFHVTIMDLTIAQGMGGREAIQELLALDPSAHAVVCSGYSDDPVMADYQAYGFKARIPKPFSGDELKRVLSELIRGGA